MIIKGTTINFSVSATVNGVAKGGLSVQCSIRRRRDNYYFDGSSWISTETWLNATEQQTGVYIYSFDHSTYDSGTADQYLVVFKCEDDSAPFMVSDTYVFGDVAGTVCEESESDHVTSGSMGALLSFIGDIEGGRWVRDGHQMVFYGPDNVTEIARFDLYKSDGTLASETDEVFERKRV